MYTCIKPEREKTVHCVLAMDTGATTVGEIVKFHVVGCLVAGYWDVGIRMMMSTPPTFYTRCLVLFTYAPYTLGVWSDDNSILVHGLCLHQGGLLHLDLDDIRLRKSCHAPSGTFQLKLTVNPRRSSAAQRRTRGESWSSLCCGWPPCCGRSRGCARSC